MNLKDFIKISPLKFYTFVVFTILVPVISVVINNYLVQQITNYALAKNVKEFTVAIILIFVFGLLTYVFLNTARYIYMVMQQDLSNQVRTKLVNHYYFDNEDHKVADVQNKMTNDLQIINTNYFNNLFNYIYGITLVVSVIIYLITLNWSLLLVLGLMTVLCLS